MKRTLIIGDVHGCLEELKELLKKLNASFNKDRIIFLGDLVHKGPYSAEVINFVFEHQWEVILGNHDDFFINALQGISKPYKELNEILPKLKMKKEELIQWYLSQPLFINSPEWIAIHGGIDPCGEVFINQDKEILMNLRFWDTKHDKAVFSTGHDGLKNYWKPWYECLKEEVYQNKRIFYGHWAKNTVQIHGNGKILGLDTGCCYGGKLTGYIIEENKFEQVESHQKKQFNY